MKADENMLDGRMLIDGEMSVGDGGANGQWIESHDPATLEPTGRVPAATANDVDRAARAAAQAQPAWAKKSVWERAVILRGLAAAIRARFAELVAFKNAYFGRSRSAATSSRIAPPIEREEIGVLTLHSVGDLTFLS